MNEENWKWIIGAIIMPIAIFILGFLIKRNSDKKKKTSTNKKENRVSITKIKDSKLEVTANQNSNNQVSKSESTTDSNLSVSDVSNSNIELVSNQNSNNTTHNTTINNIMSKAEIQKPDIYDISLEDIYSRCNALPAVQIEDCLNGFVGNIVCWDLEIRIVEKKDEETDVYRITAFDEEAFFKAVRFDLKSFDHPRIKSVNKNDKIRLVGKIVSIDTLWVSIEVITIEYL